MYNRNIVYCVEKPEGFFLAILVNGAAPYIEYKLDDINVARLAAETTSHLLRIMQEQANGPEVRSA